VSQIHDQRGGRDLSQRRGRHRETDEQELQRTRVHHCGEHRRPPPREPGVDDDQAEGKTEREESESDGSRDRRHRTASLHDESS
jgi:hypothetical protein